MKIFLLALVAIVTSLTFPVDHADAFGGRGYARRQTRHAHHVHHARHIPAPVVVQRVYVAPVATYYRAPAYYHPPVAVDVGPYRSYYGPGYPSYGGVSVTVGW